MKTLLDHMDDALSRIHLDFPVSSVRVFISDDDVCARFIRAVLQDDEFTLPNRESRLYEFSKARASHAVVTYFIGIVFSEFAHLRIDISEKIKIKLDEHHQYSSEKDVNNLFLRLWMLTSLYHDYGYFSKYIEQRNLQLRKIVKYYLLDDYYSDKNLDILSDFSHKFSETMAFSYDEIESYDEYARKYHDENHSEKEPERIDHGILGGVLIFDRLIRAAVKQNDPFQQAEIVAAKTSCITIAQHNIYKSPTGKRDALYGDALRKLHHDSDFTIDESIPLLLLLCLVDTVECVKRLGKGELKTGFLMAKTVLEKIEMDFSAERILIDYSKLDSHIKERQKKSYNKELDKEYENYRRAIRGLNTWTQLSTYLEDNIITIKLKRQDDNYLAVMNEKTEA